MRWATRPGVHIDRAAWAWLIRRFIDPDAEFVFVADPADVPADATPFDMRGVELVTTTAGDCTFETLLRRYDLTDPVLWQLAAIVHEADLDDDRYDAPEAPGLDVVLRGLSMTVDDDAGPRGHRADLRRPLRVLPPRPAARPAPPDRTFDPTSVRRPLVTLPRGAPPPRPPVSRSRDVGTGAGR